MLEAIKLLDILSPGVLHIQERCRVLEINQNVCSESEIGRLIEVIGLRRLIEVLDLDQEIFADTYPEISLNCEERKHLKQVAQSHVKTCERCRLVSDNHEWADAILIRLLNQRGSQKHGKAFPLQKTRKHSLQHQDRKEDVLALA